MRSHDLVADHYSQDDLGARIEAAVVRAGLDVESITTAELAMVDEFHTGGHPATVHILEQLAPTAGSSVLDIGCGIGGAARHCARTYDCSVTGIDLTAAYIEAAELLTGWVGLSSQIIFRQVDATRLRFERNTFDGAYLLHVGMNVADKSGLFTSVANVLGPSARFGIYDLMLRSPADRDRTAELMFPVPWAATSSTSFLATADGYQESLAVAGFDVVHLEDRTENVLPMMTAAAAAATSGAPAQPLGLHLLMGADAGTKLSHLVAALTAGLLAPIEIVAQRRP